MTCAVCGRALPEGARFCPGCGASVPSGLGTEERKVVTVLFADLVDSTGLARRLDPERARGMLGRFYDAVVEELQALRGQPEKFIGDAVMAVFGLPHVHEDDAIRAIRAGLAIVARMRRLSHELDPSSPLEVRVGIESGEAAAGVGPGGQLLVTGPVVNAAARLQGAADPGEVLVGRTTHALTETSVGFGEGRKVQAKGFEEGLTAFPVEGLSTRSTRRTIPFVGRADELALLRRSFSRVVRAGRPMLVTVAGEPGIGKTRLVEEFLASIGPDVTVLVGRSELSGDSATFGPASSIVCEAAGIQDDDTREKALRRVRELLEPLIPSGDLDRTTARLALLLGFSEERREESVFVQEVQTGFLELIDALAATRPVALQFEDVHELRPPMLDLIERTASSGRRRGSTFTLSTARPELHEERPAWGAGSLNHVSLRLEPLSDDEAVALARQAGGNELREDEAVTVAARAGGNPFFIVESTGMLLRHLHDAGEVATALLPPTVQAMIAARLDALPHAQRDLARRLAVYLYSFDVSEAALVSAACSEADLSDLVDAEIVVREEGTSPPRWRFRHETLRDVAYAGLPKRMRMELHVTIADAMLESRHPTWAADHLEKAALASLDLDPSRRGLPERASDALVRAGDRAQRRMESRSAIDYYERALALAGAQDRWGGREAWALAGIGESRYWLGDYPGATETLDQAIELGTRLSDDRALSHALRYRGDIAINVEADVARAEALLSGSLEAAERIEDQEAITRTLLFAGWVPWTRERYEEADPIWRRALELSRVIEDRWAEVRALTSLSINAEQMGRLDQASTLIEEAEAVAEETGDRFSVAVTATQRGRIDEDHMRYEDAIPHFERAVEIFGELGARWELGDALAERGIVKRELGRLDEAEEDLRQAVRISEELGERQLASWTWRALALVAERRGDHTEAETRRLRAAEAEARRPR